MRDDQQGPRPIGARRHGRWAGAGYWARFHLVRNLRRRGTLLWVVGVPLFAAAMRLGFGVSPTTVAEVVLVYLVPLMALAFGGGVLREEVEDQTLTYGFTRPLDRAALYTARLGAAMGPVLLATVPAAMLAADGVLDALCLLLAALLGTTAHASAFGLLGLLIRRPTWLGLAYVLLWEQSLEKVPGWLSELTLRAHIRNIAQLPAPRVLSMLPVEGPGPWWLSVSALLVITGLAVLLAGMIVRRRELVLTR